MEETCRVPVPLLQSILVHPLRAGSACWVRYLHGTRCGFQNSVAELRKPAEGAPRPSGHRSGTSCAHILRRYAGRSITVCKLANYCLFRLIIAYYCSFPRNSTYYRPSRKRVYSQSVDPFSGRSLMGRNR